jgi:hypothetical protein
MMQPNRLLKFACPLREQGCSKRFRSQAGRTRHFRTLHTNHNIVTSSQTAIPHGHESVSPPPLDPLNADNPQLRSLSPTQGSSPHPAQPAQPNQKFHPWLTGDQTFFNSSSNPSDFGILPLAGRPCDENGEFLPEEIPPPPRCKPGPDDWDPFEDEVQFVTGDFLYRQEEMSAGNIDILLDLWALNMAKHNDCGPFSSYEHMYRTIDNIEKGDVPWKSFTTSYAGEIRPNAPSWQLQDYEVWFRDPDVVIRNILNNPDLDGHFDYAPYIDLDKTGQRKWNEFMSGNFSWRHAVSVRMDVSLLRLRTEPKISFRPRYMRQM